MTTRDKLHQLIDRLPDDKIAETVVFVEHRLDSSGATRPRDVEDDDPLAGFFRFSASLELPDDGISDVGLRHDEYLAEIYESEWKR